MLTERRNRDEHTSLQHVPQCSRPHVSLVFNGSGTLSDEQLVELKAAAEQEVFLDSVDKNPTNTHVLKQFGNWMKAYGIL